MKNLTVYTWLFIIVAMSNAVAEVPGRSYSDQQWRDDLVEYVDFAKTTHINLHHSVSEDEFSRAVQILHDRIPELTDQAIAMEMVALATLIGDGHSWVSFGENLKMRLLPVRFYEFNDGVFVTHGLGEYHQYVGMELISISGIPTPDLIKKTNRYCSRDNEWGWLNSRIHWLNDDAFLTHEKISTPGKSVIVALKNASGTTNEIDVEPIPLEEYIAGVQRSAERPNEGLPLYRQRGDEAFWMEYLKKEKAIYVKFNQVRDKENGPRLGEFTNELIEEVVDRKAEKLIIDVRHNSGGNGNLTRRLIRKISDCDQINKKGRLFVITGRQTFSAALMFTARMEKNTNVLFVGEPGRGKPNSYSEHNDFLLTHTGLTSSVSSLFHEEGEPDDPREFIDVDISVPLTSSDFFSNRDPVLERILEY